MLATELDQPAEVIGKLPTRDLFIAAKNRIDHVTALSCCKQLTSPDHSPSMYAKLSAQTIGIESMGEKYADADEDEQGGDDLDHNFPPCIVMPIRARLRNSR